jgi:hypothetical protein
MANKGPEKFAIILNIYGQQTEPPRFMFNQRKKEKNATTVLYQTKNSRGELSRFKLLGDYNPTSGVDSVLS